MNSVLVVLAVLLGSAAVSAMLSCRPRLSLIVSLGAMLVAGGLSTTNALGMLAGTIHESSFSIAWNMPLGAVWLRVDGLSAWFMLVIGVSTVAAAIYSWSYFQAAIGHEQVGVIGSLMCVLVAGMVLSVCAGDAVLFLVGWELMSLAAFGLVGFHHRSARARRGAWLYLIATHLGTVFGVLPLLAYLTARSGSTAFAGFALPAGVDDGLVTVLFLLGVIGFGTKAGFMPMHVWLPEAHPVAPTPVSALMSGVVIKIGIYGLFRMLSWMPTFPTTCALLMLALGMASGVLGVLYALAQHDIKRLLAYHSVENIGIIGMGMGMGMLGQVYQQPILIGLGYGGALLHVLNHALFKGLLFLSAGAVIQDAGTGEIDRLGGIARRRPINAILFLIAAISICGLPPFNGFVSEWIVYGSLFSGSFRAGGLSAGMAILGIVSLALIGGLALACFAKVFCVVFLGEPRETPIPEGQTPRLMRWGMYVLAAPCVAIGLAPGYVVPLIQGVIRHIVGLPAREVNDAFAGVLAPASRLSIMAALLLTLVALLLLARRLLLRSRPTQAGAAVVTWGCGYSRPTSRMQYTASSFAWPLVQNFRSLLWPARSLSAPAGVFPQPAKLESHTEDMAERDLFGPLFRGIGELLRRVRTVSWRAEDAEAPPLPAADVPQRPLGLLAHVLAGALRRGSVHSYLMFMVITLLIVLCVESWIQSGRSVESPSRPPAPKAVDGVSP